MSFVSLKALAVVLALLPAVAAGAELRVCADPNNLLYSNAREEGFENRIAEVVADELGDDIVYVWWAQRRGLVSDALNERLCDVIVGTGNIEGVLLTCPPYYRSIYASVTPAGEPVVDSFDDPRLGTLTIGVELVGEDASAPSAAALAARGLTDNVHSYSIFGDYSQLDPLARIVEAVAKGEVDTAFVWGPVAGYFGALQQPSLVVTPLAEQLDGDVRPLAFDVSMAVRLDQGALCLRLEQAIAARRGDIDAILRAYHVPRLDGPASVL